MTLTELLTKLSNAPETLIFKEVLDTINKAFHLLPSAFKNGPVENGEHENQGSCKVLAFAQHVGLTQLETLLLFAEHYRDVLADEQGQSHQNIRAFMVHGWAGVEFEKSPIVLDFD